MLDLPLGCVMSVIVLLGETRFYGWYMYYNFVELDTGVL